MIKLVIILALSNSQRSMLTTHKWWDVVLGSFDDCLSRNRVEIFYQYQNYQEFDLLKSFVFWLGDLLTINFYLRP